MGDALIDEAMLDHASKAFEGFGGGSWEPAWRNTMWAVLKAHEARSADRIAELEAENARLHGEIEGWKETAHALTRQGGLGHG